MKKVDPTKKTQFTMEVATDTLEILYLKFKFDKESKQIYVDMFAKDTDRWGGGGHQLMKNIGFYQICLTMSD